MAKKRKAAAKRRITRKPARRRRAGSPDATVNTLVVLVVIVFVLGGLYLYAQNKRQAALWPGLMQTFGALIAPAPTPLPAIAQPASIPLPPLAQSAPQPLPPAAEPAAATTVATPDTTGSVQPSQTTASAKARRATSRPIQPAPAAEAQPPATIAVVPSQEH
jgi:hypothetical protein